MIRYCDSSLFQFYDNTTCNRWSIGGWNVLILWYSNSSASGSIYKPNRFYSNWHIYVNTYINFLFTFWIKTPNSSFIINRRSTLQSNMRGRISWKVLPILRIWGIVRCSKALLLLLQWPKVIESRFNLEKNLFYPATSRTWAEHSTQPFHREIPLWCANLSVLK